MTVLTEPAAAVSPPVAREPRWVRPAFWGLLLATGVLYLVNLSSSGYANSF